MSNRLKYELTNSINPAYGILEQVLTNRGIPHKDIQHYLNVTEQDNLSYELLNNIDKAAQILISNLAKPNFQAYI